MPGVFQNPAAEESHLMQNVNEISKTLTPVFNETCCCGIATLKKALGTNSGSSAMFAAIRRASISYR
jgi:hypothetical protein